MSAGAVSAGNIGPQQAVACEIPFYGTGACAVLSSTSIGHAFASSGNASCVATYDGVRVATGSLAVLVALDVVYGEYETTAPLHIIACAVIQCVAVTDTPALACAPEYGSVDAARVSIHMAAPAAGAFQVLPLVGSGGGRTLDASHWTYQDLHEGQELAVRGSFGAATLLAVEQ